MVANPALHKSLLDVPIQIDVVLGDIRMPVNDLLKMSENDILALEKQTTDLIEIFVSNRLMARGRLIVADGQLGVSLTEIVDEVTAH